jgi:hypothetical protein
MFETIRAKETGQSAVVTETEITSTTYDVNVVYISEKKKQGISKRQNQ